MTRRAIAYLRVSTTEQALSGLGLDAQRSAIEAECARQGWDLVATIADEGVSGSKAPAKRAGLADALDRIGSGEAEILVALRLDRLGRDAVDVLNLTKSTEVALVDFPADLTTPAGRMVLTVLAGAAELERGLISERTRRPQYSYTVAGAIHPLRDGRGRGGSSPTPHIFLETRTTEGVLSIRYPLNFGVNVD